MDDNNTKIELVCITDTHTNNVAKSTLNSFLERLVILLEGKEDIEIVENTNKGCFGVLLLLMIGIGVIFTI